MVTAHDVPVQAPLQPLNVEPACGFAVSVTFALMAKLAVHCPGQLMPTGLDVTVPMPLTVTASWWLFAALLNVAVADASADSVTEQGRCGPVQAPSHPAKRAA